MFKTISATLLAVSLLAAPALAATTGKTINSDKTTEAPIIKAQRGKASVLNANAKMGRHHHTYHRHHHHHRKMGAIKTNAKVGFKHTAPTTKRG
jgi:hypothetical protein